MFLVNLFLFGVNNNSRVSGVDNMAAYIQHKKDSRRGAYNITLYFLKDFQDLGFSQEQDSRSLTLVANNCRGQS